MVYVDLSMLVALMANEPHSESVARWYASTKVELDCATWGVTEFASALGIKERTGQVDRAQAHAAWDRFERRVANDVRLLPVDPADFHRAATLVLDVASSLRAGDALHLACAFRVAQGISLRSTRFWAAMPCD